MKFPKPPELLGVCVTVAVVFSTFSVRAISADVPQTRYRSERADCLAEHGGDGRASCLKEAAAALQAARAHQLSSPDAAQLADNARQRCKPLSGDDRTACLARVAGMGTTSGSVAGGGELHELVTTTPGTPASPAASQAQR